MKGIVMKANLLLVPAKTLNYTKVIELVKRANNRMRDMTIQLNQALERESKVWGRATAAEAEVKKLKADLAIAKDNFNRLQMEKGTHSDLIMKLVDKVIEQGNYEFRYRDNGQDEYFCPHCGARSKPIDHDKYCAYNIAQMIRSSIRV